MFFKVLPDIAANVAKPLENIDRITMYGEGNEAKLVSEIQQHGDQIFAGLNKTLGIDLKSLLLGYFGDKVLSNKKATQNS
jgi:flotillin